MANTGALLKAEHFLEYGKKRHGYDDQVDDSRTHLQETVRRDR